MFICQYENVPGGWEKLFSYIFFVSPPNIPLSWSASLCSFPHSITNLENSFIHYSNLLLFCIGSSQSSPIERPTHELSPIGQPLTNQGPLPIPSGEFQSPSGAVPTFPSTSRPQGFSTPSPGPLDGFGLSENWGSGVWGPAKASTSSVAVHAPSNQAVQVSYRLFNYMY